jgi:hypothetical protein
MATELMGGPFDITLVQDDEFDREYNCKFHVMSDGTDDDGPNAVLNTPGLPVPGSAWIWEDTLDEEVYRLPRVGIRRHQELKATTRVYWWEIAFTYSSKACAIVESSDPLLQPYKLSGSGIKYTEEKTHDRYRRPIQNSAFQQFRGNVVEFDANRPQVIIEQNVAYLEKELLAKLIDGVNEEPMWGLPARCWKFSDYGWQERCRAGGVAYYTRRLVFEAFVRINPDQPDPEADDYLISGYDRDLPDTATKVLWGHWSDKGKWIIDPVGVDETTNEPIWPDPSNPKDFMRAVDRRGNPTELILNGRGVPYDPEEAEAVRYWIYMIDDDEADANLFTGTCEEAVAAVTTAGEDFFLYGPWETEEQRAQAIVDDSFGEPRDLNDKAGFCEKMGKHHVESYDSVNLFQLGVPTDFGEGTLGGVFG